MVLWISTSCDAAWLDRGKLKILLTSWSRKYLIEHFGFLVKEKSCGYRSLRACPAHTFDQNKTVTLLVDAEIWLMLMLMLKCCERKTLFHGWKVVQNKLKRTGAVYLFVHFFYSTFISSIGFMSFQLKTASSNTTLLSQLSVTSVVQLCKFVLLGKLKSLLK